MLKNTDVEDLADWLIGAAPDGGAGQLNGVYRFLLKSAGGDKEIARADFLAFLRGEISPRMLQLARDEAVGRARRTR